MSIDPPLDVQALVSSTLRHQVRLSEFSEPVYIEEAQLFDDLVSLVVRTRDGRTEQVIVQPGELSAALEQATQESTGGRIRIVEAVLNIAEINSLLVLLS